MIQLMGLYAVKSQAKSLREFGRNRQRCRSLALRVQSVWSPRAVSRGQVGSGRGKNSQKLAIGSSGINFFSSAVKILVTVGVNFSSQDDFTRPLRFWVGGGFNTMRATLPALQQASCPIKLALKQNAERI